MPALGFSVDPEYFYALGAALPMSIGPAQRYTMAATMSANHIEGQLESALLGGIIPIPAGMSATDAASQVARRLVALGLEEAGVSTLTVSLYPDLGNLLSDWLAYTGDDADLWPWLLAGAAPHVATNPMAQVFLVLCALTTWDSGTPSLNTFFTALNAISTLTNADSVAALSNAQWTAFFEANPSYLPTSTLPGSIPDRISAFLRFLARFYTVVSAAVPPGGVPAAGQPPMLDRSGFDPIAQFVSLGSFTFGTPLTGAATTAALVFPGDDQAQAWLVEAVTIVNDLWTLTNGVVAAGPNQSALQYSLIEALFSRGFCSAQSIADLSQEEFTAALTGTVAYRSDWAGAIWSNAGGTTGPMPVAGGFQPVNPGDLVSCVPPPELSPLGPVEYLSELLAAGLNSTCASTPNPDRGASFGALIKARRGDLASLSASRANLSTPLPVIDVVNECLEHLAATIAGSLTPAGGVVHDTAPDKLAGFLLRPPESCDCDDNGDQGDDPARIFAALPEYSTPAVPVAEPDGYAPLATDFSAPHLPYDQPVDICRSYSRALGTSRYETMRTFRDQITEFVLDPLDQASPTDPSGFEAWRWRLPVRTGIAIEYLGITENECQLLYSTPIAMSGTPTSAQLLLRTLYGFPADTVTDSSGASRQWLEVVVQVPEFLKRTGLDYCEFLDLWRSGFVAFSPEGEESGFPECPPCCLDDLTIVFAGDPASSLAELAIFIRLWRRLGALPRAAYTFSQLADICAVLRLLQASGDVNPGFLRQLTAFQMLRDDLRLPLCHAETASGATGSARTQLLALWDSAPAASDRSWALGQLLDHLQEHAEREHVGWRPRPELLKLLPGDLDFLSVLAGFDPSAPTDTWSAAPSHTLRFVEALAKLCASPFSAGDLVAVLTADPHLDGDDPFSLPDAEEARDLPLDLPDDDRPQSLWRLRRQLLTVEDATEAEVERWTWRRIDACLRAEFGYTAPASEPDPLTVFACHFFPGVLERQGHRVAAVDRRYDSPLDPATTSPQMWNADPDSPFHYDREAQGSDAGETGFLWIELPLHDQAVLETLAELRQLGPEEIRAVQDVYFQPRAALANLGFLLPDLAAGERHLIEEPDEGRRWGWFVHAFLKARTRGRVLARHLAAHVEAVCGGEGHGGERGEQRAWRVLLALAADENWPAANAPWEDDTGETPTLTWTRPLVGSAFQALLGLCGTGLLTEWSTEGATAWRDISGPLVGFGDARDDWNVPVPTILPALNLEVSNAQAAHGEVRNGFGFNNDDGALVGGAAGFSVRWSGALLVERSGSYRFEVAFPEGERDEADENGRGDTRWRLELRRGQRHWTVVEGGGEGRDRDIPARTGEIALRPGAYDIEVSFSQPASGLANPETYGRARTGFAIRYAGPDTDHELVTVPHRCLFLLNKKGPLAPEEEQLQPAGSGAQGAYRYLRDRYTSTLRDIRRTYQRAFKGLLLARRLELSATSSREERGSELGYIIDHPDRFRGTAYYRDPNTPSVFHQHLANFDLNFLPVLDPYLPPTETQDDRVKPSAQRRQAIFDWWERLFDYAMLRHANLEAVRPPLWQLFQDASELRPTDPPPLTPHMDVDLDHQALVTTFLGRDPLTAPDLVDERWTLRVWRAETWARRAQARSAREDIGAAHPYLWAADDPGQPPSPPPPGTGQSGNADLTNFVQSACLEKAGPRRYTDLQELDDGLRTRGRAALLAFLCGMDRVPLPAGWATSFVSCPSELSDLLLMDVQVGLCERITRIEDGVSAVQALVQRVRLGLEPPLVAGDEFVRMWGETFSSFRTWQACRRRHLYRENWIEWDALERARREEGYRYLEAVLREQGLSAPLPAGLEWWSGTVRPPEHPALSPLQALAPSTLTVPQSTSLLPADAAIPTEGFGLLGIPGAGGSPSWLAPVPVTSASTEPPTPGGPTFGSQPEGSGPRVVVASATTVTSPEATESPPLWVEAAIRLGARFLRVAAAGLPAGSSLLEPRPGENEARGAEQGPQDKDCRTEGCCAECGRIHPPVIDEYYFWLADTAHFDLPDEQVADLAPTDPHLDTAWEDPTYVPSLLEWPPQRAVSLFWCRVHNGEFQNPRRASEVVEVSGTATLELLGRVADSLIFRIDGGEVPQTYGGEPSDTYAWNPPYTGWTASAGFRYDVASDQAVVLPQVLTPITPTPFAGLPAYPFFIYGRPGAPLIPWSAFAPAMTVAGALRAHCRFEAALRWYDLVFDPFHGDNSWRLCPPEEQKPPPDNQPTPSPSREQPQPTPTPLPEGPQSGLPPQPANDPPGPAQGGTVPLDAAPPAATTGPRGGHHPGLCCPHSCPSPAVARHRAITLAVCDTLVEMARAAMAEDSPEAFARARVILDAARRVLGPTPEILILGPATPPYQTVGAFQPLEPPINPRLMSLYERVSELGTTIHGCETDRHLRYGREREGLGFWSNDPARDAWGTVRQGCEREELWCHPRSPYRFTFLVQKALDLAGELRSFGAAWLSACEKGDAEYLAALRATHEHQLLELALSIRKDQWRDADWQIQALEKAKESAQTQVSYYTGLIIPPPLGLNSGETTYQSLTEAAMGVQTAAQLLETIGQAGAFMPDVYVDGVASGSTIPGVGRKFTAIFHSLALAMGALGQDLSSDAQLNLTQAGWNRRYQEWQHQIDIFNIQIEQIQRQILGAERRRSQAHRELESQERQVEQTAEVDDFLRDKFTADGLYLFLQRDMAGLFRQLYELARGVAHQAQHAFNIERGHTTERFLGEERWTTLREGLLAGERLELELRRMEKAYFDHNVREYELTKHISLRLNFPAEYLELRRSGRCEIRLPEWLFDQDYPGQYLRQICSMAISLPAVVGAYTGMHCSLTLLQSMTRIDPRLLPPAQRCCDSVDCDCTEEGYGPLPNDPRVVHQFSALDAIATSTGQADHGLFELDFHDQRYLPFEFQGAVSDWRLELPMATNAFERDSLTDVILHLRYRAREGGSALRAAAERCAVRHVPGDGLRLLEARTDLADLLHWRQDEDGHRRLDLQLTLRRRLFPFVPARHEIRLRSVCLLFEACGARQGERRRVWLRRGRPFDGEGGRETEIMCVASEDFGGLFIGQIPSEWLPIRWIGGDEKLEVGTICFPDSLADVDDVFFLCGYDAAGEGHRRP